MASKAPPQLLILLWHHFVFYKRHWFQLLVTLILPIPLLILFYAILAANPSKVFNLSQSKACWNPTRASVASGPLNIIMEDICYVYGRNNGGFGPFGGSPSTCSQDFSGYNEMTLVEAGLEWDTTGSLPTQCSRLSFHIQGSTNRSCLNQRYGRYSGWNDNGVCKPAAEQMTYSGPEDKLGCILLRHNIAFYPNSSKLAQRVMRGLEGRLAAFEDFLRSVPSKAIPPSSGFLGTILSYSQLFRNCVGHGPTPAQRIKGFANRQAFVAYTVSISKKKDNESGYDGGVVNSIIPDLWGGVSFDEGANNLKDLHYNLVYDSNAQWKLGKQLIWLQQLVDDVVVELLEKEEGTASAQMAGEKEGWARRELNQACWAQPSSIIYTVLKYLITIVLLVSFLLPYVNFLTQVLREKELKLREYLYIMGVGSLQLKASWVLFYQIWTIPMCFIVAGIIKAFPQHIFEKTDYMVVLISLLLYNLAAASWCLLLASFLQSPRRTTLLYVFKNLVAWILFAFTLLALDLFGYARVLAAVLSLFTPVVPLCLCLAYVIGWEMSWLGQGFWNLGDSPNHSDAFGGIGAAWGLFVGTSCLWLLLAWYLEHVFPGDYGVRQPFYFPFLPSFWCPARFGKKFVRGGGGGEDVADVEPPPQDAAPGIQMSGMSKHYTRDKIGVENLNLTFYQNEITAFLGQNGAGKSTTMNILVGIISPSSGEARVLGMDIRNDMANIRREIGFVPQYDILYPDMTVREHLQFFGWLKGLSKDEIKAWSGPLLERFGMGHLMGNVTTTLSGGQKRKLSVLTAYLGDPKVIILDEPTSGVDPFSRRAIWDMVLARRRQATTLISTHFMEEADLLGERIAILSTGHLVASGTPMYLKNRYGQGFKIVVACDPRAPASRRGDIRAFFSDRMPSSTLVSEKGTDITFGFPNEIARGAQMKNFLVDLEKAQAALGIASYGLMEPTLEEVFFTATDASGKKDPLHPVPDGDGIQLMNTSSEAENGGGSRADFTSDQIHYTKRANSPTHIFSQIVAMAYKKALYTIFSPAAWILQIILPLAFIVLLLLVGNSLSSAFNGRQVELGIWESYKSNKVFFSVNDSSFDGYIRSTVSEGLPLRCPDGFNGFSCSKALGAKAADPLLTNPAKAEYGTLEPTCPSGKRIASHDATPAALSAKHVKTPSGDIVYRLGSASSISAWLIRANESRSFVAGGLQRRRVGRQRWENFLQSASSQLGPNATRWIAQLNDTTPLSYTVLWHQPNLLAAMGNVLTNLRLRTSASSGAKDARIRTTWEQAKLFGGTSVSAMIQGMINTYFSFVFLACCFAFGTFGIAVLVQEETASGLKRMQMLLGCNPIVYWLINFIGDMILYMFTVAVVLILLAIFPNSFSDYLGVLAKVVVPYGFMTIGFTYLLSFLFRGTRGIVVFTIVSFVVVLLIASGFSGMEISYTLCVKLKQGECMFGWASAVSAILRLIPSYYIVDGLNLIVFSQIFSSISRDTGGQLTLLDDLNSFDMLGKRILTAVVAGLVYLTLCIVLEYFDMRINCCGCCRGPKSIQAATPLSVADRDVVEETQRVLAQPALDEHLVLRQVAKTYPNMVIPAVAGVTVGIPGGQCFGLLGINGAGKSTLFKMLTGNLEATSGDARMGGRSLFTSRGWGRLQGSSYCPQENTLFDALTVRQHLDMFARLRGIPGAQRNQIIECLVQEVGLRPHVGKRASQLSGGNQRKLQFAIALLDYSHVILLDEPTTGMDPGARRAAWEGIARAVRRGCAVVLTSHSMEECEALCDRLVIMVAGTFQCLGSVQYLKGKFGNQYHFQLKLASEDRAALVKDNVAAQFPGAQLSEENSSMLSYEISSENLHVSKLFGLLASLRDSGAVEDFAINQTTLERVFVKMADLQERLHSGLLHAQPQPLPQAQPLPAGEGVGNPAYNGGNNFSSIPLAPPPPMNGQQNPYIPPPSAPPSNARF